MKKVIRTISISIVLIVSTCLNSFAQGTWNPSTSTFKSTDKNFTWNLTTSDSRIKWVNKTPQKTSTTMLLNGGGIVVRVTAGYNGESMDVWDYYEVLVENLEGSLKSQNLKDMTTGASNVVSNVRSSKATIAGTHAIKTTYTNKISVMGESQTYNAIDYTFTHDGYYYSLEISYDTPGYSTETIQKLFNGFKYIK